MNKKVINSKRSKLILTISVLAALIYNSWPLGYILNPKIAGAGLASNFEAVGQPFNWLFVGGDVLTGLLVVLIAALVFKLDKKLIISLSGFVIFGVMTIVSALIPLNCKADISSCAYNQVFGWHNVTGAISALGQFLALLYAIILSSKQNNLKLYLTLLLSWSIVGLTFLLSAIPAINHLKHVIAIAVIWQDVFMVLSGLLIIAPTYIYLTNRPKAVRGSKLAVGDSK